MSYWVKMAESLQATHSVDQEVLRNGFSHVKRSVNQLIWISPVGPASILCNHSEHEQSYDNSTETTIQIDLDNNPQLIFSLAKLDFLDQLLTIFSKKNSYKIIHGHILKASDIKQAEQALRALDFSMLDVKSIALTIEFHLKMKTTEDFIRSKNLETYLQAIFQISRYVMA